MPGAIFGTYGFRRELQGQKHGRRQVEERQHVPAAPFPQRGREHQEQVERQRGQRVERPRRKVVGVHQAILEPAAAADFLAFFTNEANSARLAQFFPPPRKSQLTSEILAKANPLLNITITEEYLAGVVAQATVYKATADNRNVLRIANSPSRPGRLRPMSDRSSG